jgi:hypothetical protein
MNAIRARTIGTSHLETGSYISRRTAPSLEYDQCLPNPYRIKNF